MSKDLGSYVFLLVLLLLIVITGCSPPQTLSSRQEKLALAFDANIDKEGFCINPDTGYAVHFDPTWPEVIVGGILVDVKDTSEPDSDYILTFKGKRKTSDLLLMLDPDPARKFEVGKFYQFDLIDDTPEKC